MLIFVFHVLYTMYSVPYAKYHIGILMSMWSVGPRACRGEDGPVQRSKSAPQRLAELADDRAGGPGIGGPLLAGSSGLFCTAHG